MKTPPNHLFSRISSASALRRLPDLMYLSWIGCLFAFCSALVTAGEPDEGLILEEPDLWRWFAGGNGGYLFDHGAEFRAGQIGVDLPFEFGGFRHSLFLEVGVFKTDSGSAWSWTDTLPGGCSTGFGSLLGFGGGPYLSCESEEIGESYREEVDWEIIPITLNWSMERSFNGFWSGYLGVGLGIAAVKADISSVWSAYLGGEYGGFDDSWRSSRDDVVLYGQIFGGVSASMSEHLELFAGARAIFMDEPDVGELESHLPETDILIEGGARIRF